ncbi:MAG TPA: transglycosylase SLT domain-containing protein [Arenimonas sp.]|uniref:transglycosylase SLT domain-containing protein n=1 Tax=Arenimonas sp. TaxID=1872635 RepID=UPI002D7FBEBD|nr:transglycosylase SLT domain-containing protein [Arenimonas sp.]HEU0152637.1 transglycosylase SLT domain-containing protein [Arenimonas sp.]
MRALLLLPLSLVLLLAAAPADARRASANAEKLYDTLAEASERYREGLALIRRGEATPGREATREAAARLLEAARRCQDTRGCDGARFLAAYDALVQEGADLAAGGEGFRADAPDTALAGESAVAAAMPEAGRSVTLLKGQDLRQLIELNEPVKAAMAEWLTWMRPSLITSWENYQQMRFLMWPEYEQAGLPEALLFGILAKESNGRVHAVSRAGAAGPLQFMPATGARFGLGWRDGFDTRYDPQLAARASVLYFNERFAELNNDLEFAVAAYNGGEGRALRLKRAAGDKSFWDPSVYGQLPPETRDYVPYVLAAAWLFLHPEEYGLEFPAVDGAATMMKLQAPASIYQLAICLGGPREGYFRALRNLNPRYEPHAPIAAGTELRVPVAVPPRYQQSCLQGPRAERAIALMAASKPTVPATASRSPTRSYRVRSGDTLSAISRRHDCAGPTQLAKANGLRPPYVIRAGQSLRLIGCG